MRVPLVPQAREDIQGKELDFDAMRCIGQTHSMKERLRVAIRLGSSSSMAKSMDMDPFGLYWRLKIKLLL